MKSRNEITDLLKVNIPEITDLFKVKRLGLFGSFVNGHPGPDSDIDLLVEFESGHKDMFNYMRLKEHLETLLGTRIDLVIKEAVKPRLRKDILESAQYV